MQILSESWFSFLFLFFSNGNEGTFSSAEILPNGHKESKSFLCDGKSRWRDGVLSNWADPHVL